MSKQVRERLELHPDELVPHPENPNEHPEHQIEAIMRSISEFGFLRPVVCDEAWTLLAGHGAWMAAQRLELPAIPVECIHGLTEAQKLAYIIADNQIAELSTWNVPQLEAVTGKLQKLDFDLGVLSLPSLGNGLGDDDPILGEQSDADPADRFPIYSLEDIAEEAFDHFRAKGFPYKEMSLHGQMQELNKLSARGLDETLINSTLGYAVADHYHRHRFHATATGKRSPFDSFHNDDALNKAIRMHLEESHLPDGWFGMLSLVTNTQACANFRPAFANYIYRSYIPAKLTAPIVLDTSTGYGGRMIGFFTAFPDGTYIGVDPNTETHKANARMAEALGIKAHLINAPVEDITLADLPIDGVDLCFTSPPYFTKERYTDEDTQSWKRYPKFEQWVDEFLVPMLELQFVALNDGGLSIVNIADVQIGSNVYPLAEQLVAMATEVGFSLVEQRDFPLTRRLGANQPDELQTEPVFVLKR